MKLTYDPIKLGEYEIKWWIAHNDKDKENLVKYLALQNVELYGVSETDANEMVKFLFGAVKSHDTRDWEDAINKMGQYYDLVKKSGDFVFDSKEAAKYEVGWWELHDKLEHVLDKTPLSKAFEKLYGTIFNVPAEKLETAAKERSAATYEHDLAEDPTTPQEEVRPHWKKAEQHLVNFYRLLQAAVS